MNKSCSFVGVGEPGLQAFCSVGLPSCASAVAGLLFPGGGGGGGCCCGFLPKSSAFLPVGVVASMALLSCLLVLVKVFMCWADCP